MSSIRDERCSVRKGMENAWAADEGGRKLWGIHNRFAELRDRKKITRVDICSEDCRWNEELLQIDIHVEGRVWKGNNSGLFEINLAHFLTKNPLDFLSGCPDVRGAVDYAVLKALGTYRPPLQATRPYHRSRLTRNYGLLPRRTH